MLNEFNMNIIFIIALVFTLANALSFFYFFFNIKRAKSYQPVGKDSALSDTISSHPGTISSLLSNKRLDVTEVIKAMQANVLTKEVYKKAQNEIITYTHIAQALSADYTFLYYVNLETDEFKEYSSNIGHFEIEIERVGEDFFALSRKNAKEALFPEDQERFISAFTKENILKGIEKHGKFIITYRLLMNAVPTYVSLKATRMKDDDKYLIIGVSDIDIQMKHQKASERLKDEELTFARITALSGDYICIYTVNPDTEQYSEYSVTSDYERLGLDKNGTNFFERSREECRHFVYSEDQDLFYNSMYRDKMIHEIKQHGFFSLEYRMIINNTPTYVNLKAAMVTEKDGPKLIVGIINIDMRVRHEQEYMISLRKERTKATIDALTGAKNKNAFSEFQEKMNRKIEQNVPMEFAIVVCDVNGLKQVNDTQGHQAGDKHIQQAYATIRSIFKRSSIFRIGGDEFIVLIQGYGYDMIEKLMEKMDTKNMDSAASGGVVIACGMSKFEKDQNVEAVINRADQNMYLNKQLLKKNALL